MRIAAEMFIVETELPKNYTRWNLAENEYVIVTSIARGNEKDKCIDYHLMTKICEKCETWEKRRDTA